MTEYDIKELLNNLSVGDAEYPFVLETLYKLHIGESISIFTYGKIANIRKDYGLA